MHFTVVTTVFNRAATLERTYRSICAQTHRDFEWLVVDDGSTDESPEMVRQWVADNEIPIRFFRKEENGGKHTVWRIALDEAIGPIVAEIDSDDELLPEGLAIFNRHWEELESRDDAGRFIDVRGLCVKPDGSPLTKHRFPEDVYDGNLLDMMFNKRINFESTACWHIDRLRDGASVPDSFKYDDRAKLFMEGIRWARAARKYDTRFVNEAVRVYHFDGPNSYCRGFNLHNLDRFYNNIVGDMYFVDENIDFLHKRPIWFFQAMLRYIANSFTVKHGLREQYENWESDNAKLLWLAALPTGTAVFAVKHALRAAGLLKT
jgi:glycosyltransferase involved in cell wall biosynthesis